MASAPPKVFVSVGSRFRDDQRAFIDTLFRQLKAIGLEPHAVGVTDFSHKNPLKHIEELMRECDGSVIVAFERMFIESGTEKRDSPQEKPVQDALVPTPWNQIEAAMAYTLGHPLLVLVEEGCRPEGLLEGGYDWYVQRVNITPASLSEHNVLGQIHSWRAAVEEHAKSAVVSTKVDSLERLTFGELARLTKPSHLAAFIGFTLAWAALVAAVVANLA